jgi:chromosome partitioning protein
MSQSQAIAKKPTIIVIGNEKGGTGKSTISMHLLVHFMRSGFDVASIDVDARQGTLSRYLENRESFSKRKGVTLPMPMHVPIHRSNNAVVADAEGEEKASFDALLTRFSDKDILLVDTPGSDTYLSRYAHCHADVLITPLNDSFIDLDLLARVDPDTGKIERPSTYSEMVWDQKKQRAMRGLRAFEWIVIRNRLSPHRAKNKMKMQKTLDALSARIGFKLGDGLGERVIFRELFLDGLTLLDLKDAGVSLSLSHLTAKQELRSLLLMLPLPKQSNEAPTTMVS